MPVAGDHSNVLTRDWDAENHEDVWWEFVFVSLSSSVGKELSDTYEAVEDAYDTYEVPAADVEGLLTGYFPVTAEELRRCPTTARTHRPTGCSISREAAPLWAGTWK